jgi:hypothetical protein
MNDANSRLASAQAVVITLQNQIADAKVVRQELKEFASGTLGFKQDQVEHRFNASLRQIGERNGLSRVTVTQRDPERIYNPISRTTLKPEPVRKVLRQTPDMFLLRGTLTGTGTLEQVVKVMGEIDAQPWTRIDGFALKPVSKTTPTFTIEFDVSSPWTPDLLKEELDLPALPGERPEAGWAMRAIVARNAFKEAPVAIVSGPEVVAPAPPTAPAPPAGEAPPVLPAPPPPYAEWKLTGLVVGRTTGLQAMFSNTRTSQSLTVLRGAKVEDAVLVDGSGETAVLEIAGKRYMVQINHTLAERVPQS